MSKAFKSIVLTAQSSENHLSVKLRSVLKWLKSGHEVRVSIQGKEDRMKVVESIYAQLVKDVGPGGDFIQKIKKPGMLKFTLRPTELASNIKVNTANPAATNDDTFSDLKQDADIFSEEFEKELAKSISEERKNRKK